MNQLSRALFAAGLLFASANASAGTEESSARELIEVSQSLLDAVTNGDKALFRRLLDPQGLFIDEEGDVRRGRDLPELIHGLPPGYVGSLRVRDPIVRITGDVAIVTFDVAETLDLHGQRLNTRFHTTNIYRRGSDPPWQLIAAHTSVYPSELAPIAINTAKLDDYEGVYRLSSDVTARVWADQGHLYFQRQGRDREELLSIGVDRFVRRGAPRGERFFRRDGAGQVVELVDRRDNNDLVWKSVR